MSDGRVVDREPEKGHLGAPGRVWPALLTGTLLLFLARAAISAIRGGPVLVADEIGYLGNARAIAGGIGAQMELAPFYRGGYSLLIVPLLKLSSSPGAQYHLALVLNAALAAAVFPLLYLLLKKFAGVSPRVALWASLAGAAYPAITVLSQAAMSENALFPLVCVWLICFAGLLSAEGNRSQVLWAAGLGASTGALWGVHNRMVVAMIVALGGMAWLLYRRRITAAAALAGLVTIVLFVLGTQLLDSFVVDHNYGGSTPAELSDRLHELSRFVGLRTALGNLLGQTWYLLVATFGLAAVLLDRELRSRPRRGAREAEIPDPAHRIGVVLLILTGLLLVISAIAFPERTRPDMLIYGRYAEIAAPPLIAFGIAALARSRSGLRLARPLIGFVVLTGAVALIRATASVPEPASRWNVSALPFVTMELGPAVLIGAAVVAAGGALFLRLASRRGPRALGIVALALFAVVAAYGVWNPVRSFQRSVYPSGWTSPQSATEAAGGGPIAYDLDHYETTGFYTVQWFLPDSRIVLFHGDTEAAPAPLVLSDEAYGSEHPGSGAVEIWANAGRDESLWRLRSRQSP